ncbi:MAG TPA: hypothetical protein VD835_13965 [Pyrinomonadaceae bacterium]|nr:hypothetical protein [Pyrinomonadaceae bacterium]
MAVAPLPAPRFIRKTQLGANEYRKNFHQIDREIIAALTSAEADKVTPLMSKIYLCLVNAPSKYWERDGVLRIEAEVREGNLVKAWAVLCDLAGVASATASKAMRWMHQQGIIGYFSGKNGVGLRIFLNRAVSSIGAKSAQGSKKFLTFPHASFEVNPASAYEPAFNDSFAVRETLDPDINPGAPKNGADKKQVDKISPELPGHISPNQTFSTDPCKTMAQPAGVVSLDEIVARLRLELEPAMQSAARNAAAREHERTREWLENRGLPKAARVAQQESYNVLRKYGVISESARTSRGHADVGRDNYMPPEPHILNHDEVADLAGACVAMLETKGRSIELTLSEMSTEAGGFLLPEDAGRVRDKANALLSDGSNREGN